MLQTSSILFGRLPDLTADQQLFIMRRLAAEETYMEICVAFIEAYPGFSAENMPSDVVADRLYDRIRKLKSAKSEEIAKLASELGPRPESIRSKNAAYRFALLDKMLHETPDTEVIYETPEGVKKIQCNRAVKVKMIELMEKIEGTFDKEGGSHDGQPAGWMPSMVSSDVLGPPPNQAEKVQQLNPPPETEE